MKAYTFIHGTIDSVHCTLYTEHCKLYIGPFVPGSKTHGIICRRGILYKQNNINIIISIFDLVA